MKITDTFIPRVFLISTLTFIAACNTVPSSSSSSSSGGPPSSSSGSSSSSSSSSGSSGSQGSSSSSQGSSGSGQSSAGTSGSKTGSQGKSASQSGNDDKGEQGGAASAGKGQGGAKTDDEILADALGEFDKGINKAQQSGEEQGGEGSGTSVGATPGSGEGELTEEEKAMILEARLNNKFAKFDNLMLGEREKVARGDNENGNSGGAGYGDGGGDGEGSGDDPLQTAMADQQPLPPRGTGFPGDIVRKDISPAPGDVGNGQDDDIIARQLREAAQKEQDPELQAKLWDEYRKYKKGA
ncbi:MAG: hypothetical protein ACI9SC_000077 [Gammaproteobacteria bacterium]|jgi:hypothetical protein